MSRVNISSNPNFLNLFKSVKERYQKGISFDTDNQLKIDTRECIDNMITAIELGNNNEAFIGIFLPKMNREYFVKFPAPAAVTIKKSVPTLLMNPLLLFLLIDSYEDFVNVITHEVYHLIFKHLLKERECPCHDLANIAMDVSVNQYIKLTTNMEDKLYTLNKFNKKFNLNAEPKREFEYYYNLLIKESEKNEKNDDTLKSLLEELSESEDGEETDTLDEIKDYVKNNVILGDISQNNEMVKNTADELTIEDMIKDSIKEAKERGKIPSSLSEMLDNIYFKKPIIPWQKEFRHSIGSIPCPYRKTMRIKNRRLPDRSDILGRVNDRKVSILAAIDTSMSVSNDEVSFFLNEIFNVVKDINAEVYLLQCDAEVSSYEKIERTTAMSKIEIKGRGGTSFTPVFEYIKNTIPKYKKPDIVLYFTDGYGEYEIDDKLRGRFDLIWVLTGLNNTLSVKNEKFRRKIRFLNIEGRKYL